jgi:hypothetical protein
MTDKCVTCKKGLSCRKVINEYHKAKKLYIDKPKKIAKHIRDFAKECKTWEPEDKND